MWRYICAKTLYKIGYVQLTINSETKISKLESNVQNCQPPSTLVVFRTHLPFAHLILSKCPQLREHKIYWHFNLRLHRYRFEYSTYCVLAIWNWKGYSHDKKTRKHNKINELLLAIISIYFQLIYTQACFSFCTLALEVSLQHWSSISKAVSNLRMIQI